MNIQVGKKVLVLVDADGRVLATAPLGKPGKSGKSEEVRSMLHALPGQTLHEVALPKDIERLLDGPVEDLHEAITACELWVGPAHSVLVPRARPPGKK